MAFTAIPGAFTPINMFAMLRMLINNDTPILNISGAPVNGTSGSYAGQAGKGALLIDYTNGVVYFNSNTKTSPTWSVLVSGTGSVQYSPFVNTATFAEFAQSGVVAGATQTQAGATQLSGQMVQVATVTTLGDGIKLPASAAGLELLVINKGANAVRVYGLGADTIDDQTATVGVLQMPNSAVIYASAVAGNWYSEGLATGFGGPGLQTLSDTPTVTANATQTQAAATALVSMINRVSTVVTQGDGVRLPASAVGLSIVIINRGANAVQVYGAGTDTINGIATATGISQGVNTQATYTCSVSGNWEVPISSLVSPAFVLLPANAAIPQHVAHNYVITKAGSACLLTLAAPTAGTDDGIQIEITSDTAFAHTLTCPANIMKNGGAATTIFTFTGTTSGGGITLLAYNGTWKVMASVGGAFS